MNKYLRNIGVEDKFKWHYKFPYNVTGFIKRIPRYCKWFVQRRTYSIDERNSWNYDNIFVRQLYTNLKMYLDKAQSVVDLMVHTVFWNDIEINQLEAINIILQACEDYLTIDKKLWNVDFQDIDNVPYPFDSSKEQRMTFEEYNEAEANAIQNMQEAIKLFAQIFPYMWW